MESDRQAYLSALIKLGVNLSTEQLKELDTYAELLLKWNKTYNLIGRRTENEIYQRHLLDSLQLIPKINNSFTVIDIGSGAGLPGIPLAIALEQKIILIEPREKHCLFLRKVIRHLSLNNCLLIQGFAQDANLSAYNKQLVTARAVTELGELLEWLPPQEGRQYLFLKGNSYQSEISKIKSNFYVTINTSSSITDPEGQVVSIS